MVDTTADAVEIRDLGEMLAALRRVAQDAAGAEGASQPAERSGHPRQFETTDGGVG